MKSYKEYNTWHDYCLEMNPEKIESVIDEEYIESNDREIHLDIYGRTEDKNNNIIFIHGTSVYSRFYCEFLYELYKKGFRIIAPDLPGHGLSDGKSGHFTIKYLTSVIYDLTSHVIENYGDRIALMGSSLGGILTLYSVANDERIKAGVCHNAAILNEGAHKKIVKVKGIYKLLKPLVPFLAKIAPILRFSVWNYLPPRELVQKEEWFDKIDILLSDELLSDKYTLKSLATQMTAPLKKPIGKIETPILIINGSDDILFSVEYMEEIYEKLKNSPQKRLEIIPETSHLILHERREESVDRIVKWLEKVL
ncbi:MAG: alpha/beta fold hydrolase [Candidatus Lokiarchaeota archaeon]|nr:alpha/beta fold hydrolase [Candidatus Lokiarchaeota archaeon]